MFTYFCNKAGATGLIVILISGVFFSATSSGLEADDENPFAAKPVLFPAAEPLLGLIHARDVTSLNGQWRLIVDPMGVGLPGTIFGGFPINKKSVTGMELVEYNFDTAQTIAVPGDWNSQIEKLFFYQGAAWYFKRFEGQRLEGKRSHLHFGGANFDTQVFLNGKPIGRHQGGYVPFSFDITDALVDGSNELMVRVDNSLTATTVPTSRTDWWPYGGLTRDVALVQTPDKFIRNAKISLLDPVQKTIRLKLETSGFNQGAKAVVSIPELDLSKAFYLDASGLGDVEFSAPVDLWSPSSPALYDVIVTVGSDRLTERIGFRTIETQGATILLNGQAIKLRGISTHEEPIAREGVAFSDADVRVLLNEAKTMGANFVRAAHYPYSVHMAQVADELGILLWEEVPVYWNIAWENETTLANARNMIDRLIRRDWNRASVIVWSVANETPYSEARMVFLGQLISDVRALDDTRLVSAALLGGGREKFAEIMAHLAVRGLAQGNLSAKDEAIFQLIVKQAGAKAPAVDGSISLVIDDPLGELTDLVAYNEYFGWYYSALFARNTGVGEDVLRPLMLNLMGDMTISAAVNKPVLISEFGAGAKYGRRGGEPTIWSEEYQAKVYQQQINMLRNSEQVQGMTPWILKDFRAMLRPLAGVQDYYNRKGLLDENGNKKQAYFVLRDFYQQEWGDQGGEN